jgi:hypothetical protein
MPANSSMSTAQTPILKLQVATTLQAQHSQQTLPNNSNSSNSSHLLPHLASSSHHTIAEISPAIPVPHALTDNSYITSSCGSTPCPSVKVRDTLLLHNVHQCGHHSCCTHPLPTHHEQLVINALFAARVAAQLWVPEKAAAVHTAAGGPQCRHCLNEQILPVHISQSLELMLHAAVRAKQIVPQANEHGHCTKMGTT